MHHCAAHQFSIHAVTTSCSAQVEWEEKWWEASNWAGMREMGAEKSGVGADGSAWRETWREAIDYDAATAEPTVERTAHKWAHDAKVRVAAHLRRVESAAVNAQDCNPLEKPAWPVDLPLQQTRTAWPAVLSAPCQTLWLIAKKLMVYCLL